MGRRLKNVTRRNFVNGVAVAIGTGAVSSILSACRPQPATTDPLQNKMDTTSMSGIYPPELIGMRGSHPGSFEVAHELAWKGKSFPIPTVQTDEDYDLIIVGGGISGLATAFFYRERFGADARILILDNHDDFGGHAKRNEFDVDGHTLIGYGGSQSLESPSNYSEDAKRILRNIGVDPNRFYNYYDQEWASRNELREHVYFDQGNYGESRMTLRPETQLDDNELSRDDLSAIVNQFPMEEASRQSLVDLYANEFDYLEGLSVEAKRGLMGSISYVDFLKEYANLPNEAADYMSRSGVGIWGVGWDVLSALEAMRVGMPGTYHLGFTETYVDDGVEETTEPYIFHFPDGNASIARLMVGHLIPSALHSATMESVVTDRVDYGQLDMASERVRIRLLSTVIRAENRRSGVDVTYVTDGAAQRVRGRHAVMACYNHMLPHIIPEMAEGQTKAIAYAAKTPIVYANVALRNWRAFKTAGAHRIFQPKGFFYSMNLDYPVSMGDYKFSASPDDPIIATLHHVPLSQHDALNKKEQNRLGRMKLYQMTFEDFEVAIIDEMTAALGPFGFDANRDIAAITVNTWPHGYAYEYNELEDDKSYTYLRGPHVDGRKTIKRIAIANSDAVASAYVDGAIDAAAIAVMALPT